MSVFFKHLQYRNKKRDLYIYDFYDVHSLSFLIVYSKVIMIICIIDKKTSND